MREATKIESNLRNILSTYYYKLNHQKLKNFWLMNLNSIRPKNSSLNIKTVTSHFKNDSTIKIYFWFLSNEWNMNGSEHKGQFNHRKLKPILKTDKTESKCLFHSHKYHFSWLIANVHTTMQWANREMTGNEIVGS